MKKTFRSILAGALALLAVSCYDDSGLRDDIKKLDERVTALETTLNAEVASVNDLAAKLTAAQTAITNLQGSVGTLGTDLAALQSTVNSILTRLDAVDGETDGKIANLEAAIAALEAADDEFDTELAEAIAKIAVTKVEEKDGNVVLTLATGGPVVLSKPMSNVDNNGLVTIVQDPDTGVKYWAVVGPDGTPEALPFIVGASGAPAFKVENNELMYSADGEIWVSTGAYVSEEKNHTLLTNFYQDEYFDEDLWKWVTDDFYTLVFGGEKYQLPLYKVDNSVVVIKAGKTYFEYEDIKTFEVALKDVTTAYLMSKPDGWKAKFDGKVLTVTAPAEAKVQSGDADADGEVLLHCTTTEGKCKIAKLAVATTEGFSLTVDADGNVTIINPIIATTIDRRTGMEKVGFVDAYIGLAPVAVFESDPVAYLSGIQDNNDDINFMLDSWKMNSVDYETGEMTIGGVYVPGEYEVDRINTTVNEMYYYMSYEDMPCGSSYVVWACPVDEAGKPRIDDLVFGYYTKPVVAKLSVIEGGVTPTDVEFSVEFDGGESYYLGFVSDQMLKNYGLSFDDYMQMPYEGPFGQFQMYASEPMYAQYAFMSLGIQYGGETGTPIPATLKLSELMGGIQMPNTKFHVWVFPVISGLALTEYTYENNLKPYVYEFTTGSMLPDGLASLSLEAGESTFEQIVAEIIPDESASMVFYKFYDEETVASMTVEDVLSTGVGQSVNGQSSISAREDVYGPGIERTLAAVAVDADYKYGELVVLPVSSKILEYNDSFVAEFGEPVYTEHSNGVGYSYDFPVTVTGGTAVKYYRVFSTTEYTDEQLKNLPLGSNAGFYDGFTSGDANKLNGVYANASTTYYLYVVVESLDGKFSNVIKKTVDVPAIPAAE